MPSGDGIIMRNGIGCNQHDENGNVPERRFKLQDNSHSHEVTCWDSRPKDRSDPRRQWVSRPNVRSDPRRKRQGGEGGSVPLTDFRGRRPAARPPHGLIADSMLSSVVLDMVGYTYDVIGMEMVRTRPMSFERTYLWRNCGETMSM